MRPSGDREGCGGNFAAAAIIGLRVAHYMEITETVTESMDPVVDKVKGTPWILALRTIRLPSEPAGC